ncbi:MAG: sensor histidine kinase [Solirubrobacterales bacterium]|nr:sensor histidine kinase [Solirubrobacterales bacterium]
MKRRPIFTEVLILNAAMVTLATIGAATVAGLGWGDTEALVLLAAVAVGLTCLLNVALLRRRFNPLESLIDEMEKVDLSTPGANLPPEIDGKAETEEVERLELAFLRMMRRLEAERRRSSSAALEAQEEERARVARDLHDQVNQSLTGVLLRLEAARATAPPELRAEIAETRELAHQAMDELLAVARQLRPTALDDLGLKAAIGGQIEQLGRRGVETAFSCEGDPGGLDPETQLVIYRVSQEALGNAIRHSGAGRIEVTLKRDDDRMVLEVGDDGSGFTFAESNTGLGLGGMRERALLAGGDLDIESRPGRGTTVRLTVPARADRDEGPGPTGPDPQNALSEEAGR